MIEILSDIAFVVVCLSGAAVAVGFTLLIVFIVLFAMSRS